MRRHQKILVYFGGCLFTLLPLFSQITKPEARIVFEDNFENYPSGSFSKTKRKDGRIGFPQGFGLGYWRIGQSGGLGPYGKEEILKLENRQQALKIDRTSNTNEPDFKRNYIEAVFERISSGVVSIQVDFWVPKAGDTFNISLRQGETPLVVLDLNGERSNCGRGELRYILQFPKPLVAKCTGLNISLKNWHTIELNYRLGKNQANIYSVLLDGKTIIDNQSSINQFRAEFIDNIIFEDWTKGDDDNYFLVDNLKISLTEENTQDMGAALMEFSKTLPELERQKLLAYIEESNRQLREKAELNQKLAKEIYEIQKELSETRSSGERWRNLSRNMEDKIFHTLMSAELSSISLKKAEDFKALQDADYIKAQENIKNKKYAEAIVQFQVLQQRYPTTLLVKTGLARSLFYADRADEARKLFRSFLLEYVNYISTGN